MFVLSRVLIQADKTTGLAVFGGVATLALIATAFIAAHPAARATERATELPATSRKRRCRFASYSWSLSLLVQGRQQLVPSGWKLVAGNWKLLAEAAVDQDRSQNSVSLDVGDAHRTSGLQMLVEMREPRTSDERVHSSVGHEAKPFPGTGDDLERGHSAQSPSTATTTPSALRSDLHTRE